MERRITSDALSYIDQLSLTRREREVLTLLLRAQYLKEVARALKISVNSAKGHVSAIHRKTQIHSARELIVRYAEITPPGEPLLRSRRALLNCRTPGDLAAQCAEAPRLWTGAAEVLALAPNSQDAPIGRAYAVQLPSAPNTPAYTFLLSLPSDARASTSTRDTAESIVRIAARRAEALTPPRPAPRSQRPAQSPQVRAS